MSERPNFTSWEEYFMRPIEEYSKRLDATLQEQTGMAVADLIQITGQANGKKIIVDGFFSAELLKQISAHSRVVFLLASVEVVRNDYFNRDCKQDMYDCIQGLNHPEVAMENVFRTILCNEDKHKHAIRDSGFKCLKRKSLGTDIMDTIQQVEEHFCLTK